MFCIGFWSVGLAVFVSVTWVEVEVKSGVDCIGEVFEVSCMLAPHGSHTYNSTPEVIKGFLFPLSFFTFARRSNTSLLILHFV